MTIVLYYEHAQREYLSVSLLAELLKQKGYRVHICTAFLEKYRGIRRARRESRDDGPLVLVVPWLYNDANLGYWLEAAAGAQCAVLNLHWEQIVPPLAEDFALGTPLDEFIYHICWGQGLATRLTQAGVSNEKIFVAGHPNFDFYHPPLDRVFAGRSALAQAHRLAGENKWVLVPLNFVRASERPPQEAGGGMGGDLAAWTAQSQSLFVDALVFLAARFPQVEFILRPHPRESPWRYKKMLRNRGLPNMHIIREGQLAEWVIACDKVIFWSSTSSVEAYYAQRPFICYLPLSAPDEWIPPHVAFAPTATTPEQLVSFVESEGFQPVEPAYAEFVRQFYGLADGCSNARIAAAVDAIVSGGAFTATTRLPYGRIVMGSGKEFVRLVCARLLCGHRLPEWPKRFRRVAWWWDALRTDYVPPGRREELANQMRVLGREYLLVRPCGSDDLTTDGPARSDDREWKELSRDRRGEGIDE